MNKNFHAVVSARHWRDQVHDEVSGMSSSEKISYFQKYSSVDVLAKPIPFQRKLGVRLKKVKAA